MSKITDVGAAYSSQFVKVEISDKLRAAAQAALLALKCLDGLECAREEIANLEAALAESTIKDSLTARPWVGLTDEEIADCAEKMEASDPTDSFWREFFRGIEAKLKEKNT